MSPQFTQKPLVTHESYHLETRLKDGLIVFQRLRRHRVVAGKQQVETLAYWDLCKRHDQTKRTEYKALADVLKPASGRGCRPDHLVRSMRAQIDRLQQEP